MVNIEAEKYLKKCFLTRKSSAETNTKAALHFKFHIDQQTLLES